MAPFQAFIFVILAANHPPVACAEGISLGALVGAAFYANEVGAYCTHRAGAAASGAAVIAALLEFAIFMTDARAVGAHAAAGAELWRTPFKTAVVVPLAALGQSAGIVGTLPLSFHRTFIVALALAFVPRTADPFGADPTGATTAVIPTLFALAVGDARKLGSSPVFWLLRVPVG